jgi:hypothetical protein
VLQRQCVLVDAIGVALCAESGQDSDMARTARRLGPVSALVFAVVSLVAIGPAGPATVPTAAAASLPAWHGGIDLYRKGTFTTQKSWLWCTAADVQIIRNIVRHQQDHTTAGQRRYFNWMRDHNRYALPLSAGVDPAGWTAGLRHFVDDRYRLVSSATFGAALKSAVTNLRKTNLPVGITVSHGGHAWIITGFTATADPLKQTSFTVTSVRVVGPLYGLQSKNGYDMKPDTKLTPAQLRHYFTPWKYDPKPMIWDGRYVSIQPIPLTAAAAAPSGSAIPSSSTSLAPAAASGDPSSSLAGAALGAGSSGGDGASPIGVAATSSTPGDVGPGLALAIATVILAAAVMTVGIGRAIGSPRTGRSPGSAAQTRADGRRAARLSAGLRASPAHGPPGAGRSSDRARERR